MNDDFAQIMQRYQPILASLKPSARAWVEELAKIEAGRPSLDLNALRTAIQQRFADSLPTTVPQQAEIGVDVAEIAIIIILLMVQDGDKDLQEKMQEAQAQMQAKQSLRNLLNELNLVETQIATQIPGDSDKPIPSDLNCICITPQQLSSVMSQLNEKLAFDDDLSEQGLLQLQILLDARSKLLQTAYEMEKNLSGTDMAIIGNLK